MQAVCESHGEPLMYVCMNENCPDSAPVCAHEDCVTRHLHAMEIRLLPLSVTDAIEQRRTQSQDHMARTKLNLAKYFGHVRDCVLEEVHNLMRGTTVIDKIVLGINNLSAQTVTGIDNLLQRNYTALDKASLGLIYQELKVAGKEEQSGKLDDLLSEIEAKEKDLVSNIECVRKSPCMGRVYRLDLFDLKKRVSIPRFGSESSSWSFSTNKVDAIQFTSTDAMLLAGFVHMPLINCPGDSITLLVKVVFEGHNELEETKVIPKATCLEKEFEVLFTNPVAIQANQIYDLSSENTGAHFQAKSGSGAQVQSGPFKFDKSKYDNNGTSQTTGQFKALLCFPPL